MKIYEEFKLMVDKLKEDSDGRKRFIIYPLTKDGKKSKRESYFVCGTHLFGSGKSFINACRKGLEPIYASVRDLQVVSKRFPKALFVFDEHFGVIHIIYNKSGYVRSVRLSSDFKIVDYLIISYYGDTILHHLGVEAFLPRRYHKYVGGNKCHINSKQHEVIISQTDDEHLDDYKKLYYIDTMTLETKRVREFFDGVEI